VELSQDIDDVWCVVGDFNFVLNFESGIGRVEVLDFELKDFVDCIEHYEL